MVQQEISRNLQGGWGDNVLGTGRLPGAAAELPCTGTGGLTGIWSDDLSLHLQSSIRTAF